MPVPTTATPTITPQGVIGNSTACQVKYKSQQILVEYKGVSILGLGLNYIGRFIHQ